MEMERSDEFAFQEIPVDAEKIELDPLPEFCDYRDEGCEMAGSCLNCPFSRCIYDEPRGKQRWLMKIRAGEMAKLFAGGKQLKELARMFGVSQRTVKRALKQNRQVTSNK
ncbi:MAG: helix-turn-helix domain-containing protein [Chloroflexi bacterium]|nr:helix-turn-helix domain-containing protein [Chloroflexota bacterium]